MWANKLVVKEKHYTINKSKTILLYKHNVRYKCKKAPTKSILETKWSGDDQGFFNFLVTPIFTIVSNSCLTTFNLLSGASLQALQLVLIWCKMDWVTFSKKVDNLFKLGNSVQTN